MLWRRAENKRTTGGRERFPNVPCAALRQARVRTTATAAQYADHPKRAERAHRFYKVVNDIARNFVAFWIVREAHAFAAAIGTIPLYEFHQPPDRFFLAVINGDSTALLRSSVDRDAGSQS
jgi:hypothetical protein